ncbi:MAG: ABC transporter ATP-binding protein [Peptococcaceae bacterium]|nr:ABC transporter ATP-binding protein [Peptococcaceae bacterium]
MNSDNAVLRVDNLEVHYGDFQALRKVSLQITGGSVTSIIGANGSGKSTLMKAISGLLKPTAGTVSYMGRDITGLMPDQIVDAGISLVPEGGAVFPRMTVLDNLIIGSYSPKARKKKNTLLGKVYKLFPWLAERSNQLANNLSGGERQMLAIGRALMSDPKLILFDEISLGLAPRVIKDIYQKIKDINRDGTTVVLVEQDVKRSLKFSETSYVMLEGKVVLSGKSCDLAEDEVRKAYFGI